MRKFGTTLVCLVATLAVGSTLALCGCNSDTTTNDTTDDTTQSQTAEEETPEEEPEESFSFAGTWTYSAEVTVESVYGPVSTTEEAFQLELADDGTATLTPADGNEVYAADSGTWEANGDEATISLDTAGEFTATKVDDETIEVPAGTFSADDAEAYELVLE